MYPLKTIINIFNKKKNIQTSIKLIYLQNNISILYKKNTIQKTKKILSSQIPNQNNKQNKKNYSNNLNIFTINKNNTKNLNNTINIQIISKNKFKINIHISNINNYIKKNNPINIKTKKKSTTYYPNKKYPPYHILPKPIKTNIYNLLPNQKQKTLSIFYKINILKKILNYKIKPTLIKSQTHLTYHKTQKILSSKNKNINLKKKLYYLQNISKILQSKHLKNKIFSFPFKPLNTNNKSYFQSLNTHHIIKKLIILINKTIKQNLIKTFPNYIPLHIQPTPSTYKIQK